MEYDLKVNHKAIKGILLGEKGKTIDHFWVDVETSLSKLYQKPVSVVINIVIEPFTAEGKTFNKDI